MSNQNIPSEDFLYKRVPPLHYNFDEDRVSAGAFKTSRLKQSVNWDKYSSEDHTLAGYPSNTGLLKIQAGVPREQDLEVVYDPLEYPEDPSKNNLAHTHIQGKNLNKEKCARYLADNSKILKKPLQ